MEMNWTDILQRLQRVTHENSPMILTAVGSVGVLTTGVLAAHGGIRAHQILEDERRNVSFTRTGGPGAEYDIPLKRRLALTWKPFAPACLTGLTTVTAIIAANQIGTRRAAAMAVAYTTLEKASKEYREKVIERFGDNKEQKVRDELAQDRLTRAQGESREVVILEGDDVLCFDSWSGRLFKSNTETLKKAMNDLNYRIINDNYASLTDFYNLIGLPPTSGSDELGWNVDNLLEIEFATVLAENGKPAISIDFRATPIAKYFRLA